MDRNIHKSLHDSVPGDLRLPWTVPGCHSDPRRQLICYSTGAGSQLRGTSPAVLQTEQQSDNSPTPPHSRYAHTGGEHSVLVYGCHLMETAGLVWLHMVTAYGRSAMAFL